MATSSKNEKASGSGRKAADSAKKGTGSARKTAAGSARKTAGGSARKTAAGSARKTAAGSARKTAAGSARKTAAGSGRKPPGSDRKTSSGAGRKTSPGAGRKTSSGAGRKTSSGAGRKTSPGAGRKTSPGAGRKTSPGARKTSNSASKATGSGQGKGIYVYGILPADVELASEMPGVGDPPGEIRVVRSDGLAALVSEVDLSRPLGSPDDLTAHKEILDATVAELPVLPVRFGAVMTSEDAVAEELLAANHDEFAEALDELDGRAQFVVKGRYVGDAILDEVLSESKQAAQLAGKIRGKNPDATRDARIQLGEMINEAVAAKREQDTRVLGEAMEGQCVASVVRDPTHELDAIHVAFLVDTDRESGMERVIEDLARDWDGRIELRLLGPMAAYDFVGIKEPVT